MCYALGPVTYAGWNFFFTFKTFSFQEQKADFPP